MSYSEENTISRAELLQALRTVHDLPKFHFRSKRHENFRTIYECGDWKGKGIGRFSVDYATFAGGTTKEVPLSLIEELEREGVIVKAYPDSPDVKAWVLNPEHQETGGKP